MGKLNDSLLSGSSGRTGRLVVANVAGTEILRVRPRRRNTPPTPKQLLIQERMKKCYDFLSSYKAYASKFFGVKIGMRSCYNLAMSNLLDAFKIDFNTMQITPQYPEIAFSKGPLLQPIITGLASPAANSVQIQWYNNAAGDPDREADQAQILYVAEGNVHSVFLENAASRLDTELDISLSPDWQGKTIHMWLAFRTDDLLMVSGSVYAGSVVVS